MEDLGLSVEDYAYRHRDKSEPLPWDHLDAGLYKDFLWQEWRDALEEVGLEDCRWTPCYDCGACTGYGLDCVVASTSPPVGGSQGTWQDLTKGSEVPQLLTIRKKAKRYSRMLAVRLRSTKKGKIRFASHRDIAKVWERTLWISNIPLMYSQVKPLHGPKYRMA